MSRKIKYLGAFTAITALLLFAALIGCDGNGGYFTVSFNAGGGEPAPAKQKVQSGGLIAEPAEMALEGYDFGSWYKDPECTEPWDFEHDVVTENITLYAKWTPSESEVKGGGGGGGGGGGTPPPGTLSLSPTSVAYGSVTYDPVLVRAATNLTITNNTAAVVNVTGITLGGANAASFALGGTTPPPDINIAAAGSASFTVQPNAGLAVGSYNATVTVANDAGAALKASVGISVTKANPAYTWPSGLTATVGQTLSDISLPGNGTGAGTFAWTAAGTTPVGAAGTNNFGMTFTPSDTANYNTITGSVAVTVNAYLIEMVLIPEGSFIMGSPVGEPNRGSENQYPVTLSRSFYMGKYPVTQGQWKEVMGQWNNPSNFKGLPDSDDRPVEMVSWYDAVEFCNKLTDEDGLGQVYTITGRTPAAGHPITFATVTADFSKTGYRLPTEAEWEYACRGDYTDKATEYATLPFGVGDGTKLTGGMANFDTYYPYDLAQGGQYNDPLKPGYVGATSPVGGYGANNYDLYDMHGNVWEWCWDLHGAYPTTPTTDPLGAVTGTFRVLRGGCWNYYAHGARSAYRSNSGDDPSHTAIGIGFRLVRCP